VNIAHPIFCAVVVFLFITHSFLSKYLHPDALEDY